jgi:uncharacterized protein YdhG (YjbR/CyaY superfamily)
MNPTAKKATQPAAKEAERGEGFTREEKAAMRARTRELKNAAEGESAALEAIAAMSAHDRAIAERVHALIKESAPTLTPKTWYGMPAYAKDGKVVCYFRNADKFKERYAMVGFNDSANLDQDTMWPVAYALTNFTPANEAKLRALIKKAAS